MPEIAIDNEFKGLVFPLAEDEYRRLNDSIMKEGCRDALLTWRRNGKMILIDGHNRFEICRKNKIVFQTKSLDFPDRNAAKIWIVNNQLARRNLTLYQKSELVLKLKPLIAEKAKENQCQSLGAGKKGCQNSDNLSIDTKKELARLAGVSHDTICKVEKIDQKADESTKVKLRSGEITVNQAYKDIKKDERRELQKEMARRALAEKKDTSWTVTNEQEVIKCNALITDPPYGILGEAWEPEKLNEFTRDWAKKWSKCGADFVMIFWSQDFLFDGKAWFDESLDDYEFRQLLVWHYPNNKSPQSRKKFKQTWEPIFFYAKKGCEREVRIKTEEWGNGLNDFDCHVAAVPQTNFTGVDFKIHAAQKPLSVMRWLVNLASDVGEMVCDPFCGSGTTGIAAVQLGRRFHGIDREPNFVKLARERIAAYGELG